ncbi:hypothetical protein LuPra_02422 [Luteitalea pratensis]|uniref:Uncharacterized protein n=1 Tax=Luteitalea pratensis TaxID=1855912 RepID=A0A143PN75_LUTPR|nr:hypothetical protein [Luteitalea pratensis]AMY09209.1 hypothetical protein LuPra_02422 [Luteitalea pratensis]
MDHTGRLELKLVDVDGHSLTERVDVGLRHHVLDDQRTASGVDATRVIAINDLRREPQGLYVLEVRAPSYRSIRRFVSIPPSGARQETVALPIRPDRARAVFPDFDDVDARVQGILDRSHTVAGHEGVTGRALYEALSDEARAGLLNIAKKSLATQFTDGADLLPHVTLLEARRDRCFVSVPQALRVQMPSLVQADHFHEVNGALHKPPPGFVAAGSFKTGDAFGNLQVTFFTSGSDWRADIDIDDAAGLGHVFQVVRNELHDTQTHPFDIHQLLMAHQHLDPGYRLLPRA